MSTQLPSKGKLWIYMEGIESASLGLLHKLRSMGDERGKIVEAIITEDAAKLGECGSLQPDCNLAPIFSNGAQKVYRLLGKGDERQIAGQITALCREHTPEVLIFLATIKSRDIAAMAAAELRTGLSADCTGIDLRPDNILVQTRPTFGGLLFADIVCPNRRPQIATIRHGIFLPGCGFSSREAEIIDVPKSGAEASTRLLHVMSTKIQPLQTAQIVLSGGRGVESEEGMQQLQRLAMLTGASVGASRGAVSAGYARYEQQIGLTGQTIRPDVYIAFGISGAVQHLVGIERAKTIIAVNSDKKAPIFEYADIGIVSDWKPIVQNLIEIIKKGGEYAI